MSENKIPEWFNGPGYNPQYYEEIQAQYNLGNSYRIEKWDWDFNTETKKSVKKIINTYDCPTLKDFNLHIWDLFSDFAEENTNRFVWGPFGLKNGNPYRPQQYYFDGSVFPRLRKEFMECVENQNISRFLSCLNHYGYYHVDYILMENS